MLSQADFIELPNSFHEKYKRRNQALVHSPVGMSLDACCACNS